MFDINVGDLFFDEWAAENMLCLRQYTNFSKFIVFDRHGLRFINKDNHIVAVYKQKIYFT